MTDALATADAGGGPVSTRKLTAALVAPLITADEMPDTKWSFVLYVNYGSYMAIFFVIITQALSVLSW